jgi:hypothetical protein
MGVIFVPGAFLPCGSDDAEVLVLEDHLVHTRIGLIGGRAVWAKTIIATKDPSDTAAVMRNIEASRVDIKGARTGKRADG